MRIVARRTIPTSRPIMFASDPLSTIKFRRDIPVFLNREHMRRIAEVGVRGGDHLQSLLRSEPEELFAVDLWEDDGVLGHNDAKFSQAQIEQCYGKVLELAAKFPCIRVRKGRSIDVAREFADKSLDFVYIDADHSFAGVANDIGGWWPKTRAGGVLAGHDYVLRKNAHGMEFGVVQAVHEFLGRHNLQPFFHCTWPDESPGNWFIRKPIDWRI